jgi:hypothetical protein
MNKSHASHKLSESMSHRVKKHWDIEAIQTNTRSITNIQLLRYIIIKKASKDIGTSLFGERTSTRVPFSHFLLGGARCKLKCIGKKHGPIWVSCLESQLCPFEKHASHRIDLPEHNARQRMRILKNRFVATHYRGVTKSKWHVKMTQGTRTKWGAAFGNNDLMKHVCSMLYTHKRWTSMES